MAAASSSKPSTSKTSSTCILSPHALSLSSKGVAATSTRWRPCQLPARSGLLPLLGQHPMLQPPSPRRRCRPRLAMLAPLWDKAATFLQQFIYTRARVHPSKGLSFATCSYCTRWPWHRHFFSPPWPDDALGYWDTTRGNHAQGLRVDGLLFVAPTHRNLFWLSTVRIWDASVSGVCVCRRPDGLLGNTRYFQYFQ